MSLLISGTQGSAHNAKLGSAERKNIWQEDYREISRHGTRTMHSWTGDAIRYENLDLEQPWESFDVAHALTTQGIERFAHDYDQALAPAS